MNRNVVITGATSGIGKAFAEMFAGMGDSVILIARNEGKLKELCGRFLKMNPGREYKYFAADLSKEKEAESVCSWLYSKNIDILVNNAGFGMTGAFMELDGHEEEEMMYLNIFALTKLTKYVGRQMVLRGKGYILNVSSLASFMPNPYGDVYAATKAYVKSFTEGLSEELNGTGVFASVLCPGPTKTGFGRRSGMDRTKVFSGKVMLPETVVKIAYRKMLQHKIEIVPGVKNKLGAFLSRAAPLKPVLKIAADELKIH